MATRYNTGNQVPSNTMMDLSDNVQVLDELLNRTDGTTTLRTGEIVPVIQQQVAERIDGLTATAQEAIDTSTANAAAVAEDKVTVQALADTVTTAAAAKLVTTITSDDPDGTIAGLAATTDGESFYVAQGTEANIALKLYLNNSGSALAVADAVGKAAVDAVYEIIKQDTAAEKLALLLDKNGLTYGFIDGKGILFLPGIKDGLQNKLTRSDELITQLNGLVNKTDNVNLLSIYDKNDKLISFLQAKGHFYIPLISGSIQNNISRLDNRIDDISLVNSLIYKTLNGNILSIYDINGNLVSFLRANGHLHIPLLKDSVQNNISRLDNRIDDFTAPTQAILNIVGGVEVGNTLTVNFLDKYEATAFQWTRDGSAIPGATDRYYEVTIDDIGHQIDVIAQGLSYISDGVIPQGRDQITIGGLNLESVGATGSIYEGYTLSCGDDFDTMDILSPMSPLGKWFTTRTYLVGARGSDTLLGTMYDTDPYHTGYLDKNRGIPVEYNNFRVNNSVIELQARRGTPQEMSYAQGTRTELSAMVSGVGAFAFYPGMAGDGDIIVEWRVKFTDKSGNPKGWHPALWLQSATPSPTFNSDEIDVVEGNSQSAVTNQNLWGPNGSKTGGGKIGNGSYTIFDNQFHTVAVILNKNNVSVYIDEVLSTSGDVSANTKDKPYYVMISNHVYNGSFLGETYAASDWASKTAGATIYVDWNRVWRRTGKSHIVPLIPINHKNMDFGSSVKIVIPGKHSLWGKENVLEYIQSVMHEENEPGASHTVAYNQFPAGVSYNESTRTLTVAPTDMKSGRLNFVMHGYLPDGSTCEPSRFYVNIGPVINTQDLNFDTGESVSYDLYQDCDCGVLVTDGTNRQKKISVSGLTGSGLNYNDTTGLITGLVVAGTFPITVSVFNSVNQSVTKNIIINVS